MPCRQDPLLTAAPEAAGTSSEQTWRAASLYGCALLGELCREGHPAALKAWAAAAPAIRDAVAQATAACGAEGARLAAPVKRLPACSGVQRLRLKVFLSSAWQQRTAIMPTIAQALVQLASLNQGAVTCTMEQRANRRVACS